MVTELVMNEKQNWNSSGGEPWKSIIMVNYIIVRDTEVRLSQSIGSIDVTQNDLKFKLERLQYGVKIAYLVSY